jgi:hypothetical protein
MGLVIPVSTDEHGHLLWQICRAFSYDQDAANSSGLHVSIGIVLS